MQNLAFVGKIYNMKAEGKGDKMRLNFSLAVRKKYVSDEDKKAGKTNVFVPLVAFGKTAQLIEEYFEDGKGIAVSNCEYSTWEGKDKNGDKYYGHNFKVGGIDFLPTESDDSGSSKKSRDKKKKRYDDEDEDEAPRRRKKPRYDDEDEEEEERPRRKKKPVYDDEDEDDDDVPF